MKQEDKDLLLRDLCARIPYGVKVQAYSYGHDIETIETLYAIDSDGYMSTLECDTLNHISKPYLFPLSSMTEEQYENFLLTDSKITLKGVICSTKGFEFLNANHFDYQGLIPMGLAIDCTNLNIY